MSVRDVRDGAKTIASQLRRYFAALPPDTRRAAQSLRAAVRAAVPGAVEHFSYGIPGFRLEGRPLLWYAGWKQHTSLYPMTAAVKREHATALAAYKQSKGTVRFSLERAVPISLVKRIAKTRASEVRAKVSRSRPRSS